MRSSESRFEEVTRRAFLKRMAALGAIALVPGLAAACARDDGVLADAGVLQPSLTPTLLPPSATASPEPQPSETHVAEALSADAEMAVHFAYAASGAGQGPVRNPYVAVWVEDENGEWVSTIALWFLQSRKGSRWLADLRRWYMVDGTSGTVNTISGATRTPGEYALLWDGTGTDGARVAPGTYYVCIEAAREHGPYSLIRDAFTIGDQGYVAELPDDGELRNARIELSVA